jgi:hypothetical protein
MYDCPSSNANRSSSPMRGAMSPIGAPTGAMSTGGGFLGGVDPTIAIAGLILATSFFKR